MWNKYLPEDGMRQSISLIDWDCVGNTITGIQDDTGCPTRGVQGEYSLDGHVHGGGVEGFEHDLGHLLPVGLGVEGSLSEQDGLLLGGNAELIVEGVMPDLLHVVPVGDDAVLNRVLQGENTSLGLGLISDIGVLLTHTHHDTLNENFRVNNRSFLEQSTFSYLVPGASNDGGEDSPGGVISGKASFAHARAIVDDKGSNVLVTHFGRSLD